LVFKEYQIYNRLHSIQPFQSLEGVTLNDFYDVVVIGAGLAGLSSGAYICRDGHSLLICEQSDQTGGYFRSFKREGFVFDAGLKAVENAGMLLPMLHQLKLDKKVNLHKSASAMFLADRLVPLKEIQDIQIFYNLLEEYFPEQRNGLKALKKETDKISQWVNIMVTLPNPLFEDSIKILGRLPAWLFQNFPGLINFRRTQSLLEVPLTDFLSRYLTDRDLIRILTELYFAGTPALFGLGYSKIYLDYYYPEEGMQSLTDVLGNYIIEKGGQIQTRTKVTKINVINGQATGVELEDGRRIMSKYVITSADMKHTFLDLIEDQALAPDFLTRIEKAEI
jgi:phytoene dehydrogenase-like protein